MIQDHAICVRTWDWSETSQTAVLLTREHGMVRVLAKGSKRDRSAFSGGLELCTAGQMNAIIRPNSDLTLLTQWDLLEQMSGIRKNLRSYSVSMLGIDLIPRLIQDHDPHPEVHDALLTLLHDCSAYVPSNGDDLDTRSLSMLAWYLWHILVAVGAMPIVDHDVLTGDPLEPSSVYGFSAQLGGITQDPITGNTSNPSTLSQDDSPVWRVRAQTVQLMGQLGGSPPCTFFLNESKDQIQRLARLLGAYIRERTGTDIPAMNWLLDLE